MRVRCEKCRLYSTIDDALVKPEGTAVSCTECGAVFTIYTAPTAKRESVNEFIGKGCFVQGFGLLLPLVGWMLGDRPDEKIIGAAIGFVICLALLAIGSRLSVGWRCGACKNPIASGEVRVCAACRERLA